MVKVIHSTDLQNQAGSTGKKNEKVFLLSTIVVVSFVFYLLMLFKMQVVEGANYRQESTKLIQRTKELPAQRGEIYDRKAIGFKGLIERIAGHGAAVCRKKDMSPLAVPAQRPIFPEPAFYAAPLIVIASRAVQLLAGAGMKSINIKIPHVIPDPDKIFDQFAVGHDISPNDSLIMKTAGFM